MLKLNDLKKNYSRRSIISSCTIFLVIIVFFVCLVAFINFDHLLILSSRVFSAEAPAGNNVPVDPGRVQSKKNPCWSLSSSFSSSLSASFGSNKSSSSNNNSTNSDDEIRVLIGILTHPDHSEIRDFVRRVYKVQPRPSWARVDVKFVFCNLTKEDQKFKVQLEIMSYDDIIILNCVENMDDGKTYTYFSSLPDMLCDDIDIDHDHDHELQLQKEEDLPYNYYPPYHYVMKTDDDTFIRVAHLAESLKPLSRHDLYYGFVVPCHSMKPGGDYMSGMGYLVSWDIVEWIRDSDIPRKHQKGPEDLVFGKWLKEGGRAANSFNAKWMMYDHPGPQGVDGCKHNLWPGTIAVHKLKTFDQWLQTLKYFNLSATIKPSKLYHI